jgi:hypothetical protein
MGTFAQQLLLKIKAEAAAQLEDWIDAEGVPLAQQTMEQLHYRTGRLTASIRKTAPNVITIGGSTESPTGEDDGRGAKLVDYAAVIEARYAPVRGAIVPALEEAIG